MNSSSVSMWSQLAKLKSHSRDFPLVRLVVSKTGWLFMKMKEIWPFGHACPTSLAGPEAVNAARRINARVRLRAQRSPAAAIDTRFCSANLNIPL